MRGRGRRAAGRVASITITLASLALTVAMTLSSLVFETIATGVRLATGLTTVATEPQVRYRGRTIAARDAVSDASGRIQRRVAAASAAKIATAAGEALPFVGVGVIVAATAYELNEACALSRDLRELDAAFNPDDAVEPDEICGITPPTRDEVWAVVRSSPGAAWGAAASAYEGLGAFPASAASMWRDGRWTPGTTDADAAADAER